MTAKHTGRPAATRCRICGILLTPGNKVRGLCKHDAKLLRSGSEPIPKPPAAPHSLLGQGPGPEDWPDTDSQPDDRACAKIVRAWCYQDDIRAGRPIRYLPAVDGDHDEGGFASLADMFRATLGMVIKR